MAKLSLVPNPTFKAKVAIPQAGGDSVEVEFTFKHRTKTELSEFVKGRAEKSDVETFMDMVSGWELSDAFTEANAAALLEGYIGAALATYQTYIDELVKHKAKN